MVASTAHPTSEEHMAWEPLSVREGRREPDGSYEGVPDHLRPSLFEWLDRVMGPGSYQPDSGAMARVIMLQLRIPPSDRFNSWGNLINACRAADGIFLDVLDFTLGLPQAEDEGDDLQTILALGGSVWTVSADGTALERRVDSTVRDAASAAMRPDDEASGELAQAWSKTFGRHPDPSDAWDHAIKAVEALAIPLVIPKKDKPNLGGVAGELKAHPDRWTFALGPVATFESMLRLMWVNPDRHGGADRRTPSQEEAEAVTLLTVTLVQWLRTGALRLSIA